MSTEQEKEEQEEKDQQEQEKTRQEIVKERQAKSAITRARTITQISDHNLNDGAART